MSITDKFNYLKQTKENLKEVINLVKDENEDKLTGESTFRSYPEALRKNYIKALNEGSDFIYDSLDKVTEEGETVVLDNTAVAPMKVSLNGNMSQEKINAEAGTEIVNTEISVSDVDNEKENYITLQGNAYQETIEAQAGSEVEDTELAVNDVDSSKENYITLKGNTSQDTTNGKNKFSTDYLDTYTYDTYTQLSKNSFEFNATTSWRTSRFKIPCKSNTDYYFNLKQDLSVSTRNVYIVIRGVQTGEIIYELYVGYLKAFNSGENTELMINIQSGGAALSGKIYNIQLEEGTSPTEFEEYTGGIPSPNPDYPQEVKVVTGENVASVSGKNLIDKNGTQAISAGAELSILDTGIRATITTAGAFKYVGLLIPNSDKLLGKTITLSANIEKSGNNTPAIYLYELTSDNQLVKNTAGISFTTQSRSFTLPQTYSTNDGKTASKFALLIYGNTNGTGNIGDYVDYKDLQLEYGSTATPYVPYSKTDYEVNLGKNLFDYQNQNYNEVRASYVLENNGLKITSSGSYAMITTDFDVKIGKTYTISFDTINSDNMAAGIQIRSSTALIISGGGDTGNHSLTFTPTENKVHFRFYSNTSGTETINEVQYQNIQIEEGSVATSYSSYFTPIELCKIGDYQDYLFKNNGKWYIHREVGKYKLDENTSFAQNWNTNTDYETYCIICGLNTNLGGNAIAISNILPYVSFIYAYDKIGIYQEEHDNGRIIFRVPKTIASNISEFKTWLVSNNMIVYTPIMPVEEEITNIALIEQLNNLYIAQLNNEVNYINTETENLLPYINLKYNVATQMPSPEKPSEIETVKGNNVVSVSGKNLFPINNIDLTLSGIRLYTQDGSFIANGTATSNIYETNSNYKNNISFNLKKGTYTLSLNATEPHQVTLRNRTTGDMLARVNGGTTLKATFTLEEDAEVYIGFYFAKDVSFDNVEYKIQLEEGSTANEYTPYSKIDYPINLDGKNLFNMNNATYVKKYGSSYSVDGQEITVTPTTTWGNVTYSYKVENNTTYTLKMKITFEGTTQTRWWLSLGNEENDAVYNGGYIDLEDGYLIKTFTTTSKILTISFQGSTTIQPTSTLFSEIQLELGSTATDYEPYIAPIELCKIGNYQDYLYKNNGKWYVHKAIGKKVVTSSETLAQTDSYSKVRYFKFNKNTNDIDYNKYNNADIFYTSAKNVKNVYNYDDEYMIGKISPQAENVRYWVGFPKGTTLAQAKEKLVGSILYYVLTEPVETEITSLTLIEQLDNLYTAQLNNEINYITTETGNLLPYIDLKYNVVTQMPSPERPSEVKVVKGENVVSVSGKNLLNVAGLSNNSQGVVSTGTSDGKVACVGTASTNYFNVKPKSRFSLSAGTYIFSIQTAIANRLRIRLWDSSDNIIGTYNINAGNTSVQFTINENAEFLMMFIDSGVATGALINITMYPMIRLSSEIKTDFVPYSKTDYPINLGDIELCKINTYKDYFYKDSGKWYVHKEITKKVFSGIENLVYSGSASTPTERTTVRWNFQDYINLANYFSNRFVYNSQSSNRIVLVVNSKTMYISTDNTITGINVEDDEGTKVSKIKNWLSNNNVSLYCVLATPTEEEITNSTLIEQLEAIVKAKSVKDKTYITQTNEEIPFIIDATAIKKYEEVQ